MALYDDVCDARRERGGVRGLQPRRAPRAHRAQRARERFRDGKGYENRNRKRRRVIRRLVPGLVPVPRRRLGLFSSVRKQFAAARRV